MEVSALRWYELTQNGEKRITTFVMSVRLSVRMELDYQ